LTGRIAELQKLMAKSGIDCLFVSSLSDIFYLTGFTGSTAMLFVDGSSALFMTDGRYEQQIKSELYKGIDSIIVNGYQESASAQAGRYKNVHVTYSCGLLEYETLVGAGCDVDIDRENLISGLRMIKNADEILQIKDMYRAAYEGFVNALPVFVAGNTEDHWAAELEKQMKLSGAKTTSFDTIVASGARGALPHGVATRKKVEANDPVVLDYGCKLNYCSDVTRLVIAGENAEAEKIADIVYTALKKASEFVREGVRACDADAVAREYIESMGYGKYFNHSLGHGVGIDVHEKPSLNRRDETVLKAGMVVTIEPGIYLPEQFGVRLEDTVLVTENGCENLTAVFDRYIYKNL